MNDIDRDVHFTELSFKMRQYNLPGNHGPKKRSLGCVGSTATRTMGKASRFRGKNGGQTAVEESVADFNTCSSKPPIPG